MGNTLENEEEDERLEKLEEYVNFVEGDDACCANGGFLLD